MTIENVFFYLIYIYIYIPENLRCVKNDGIKNFVVDLQADNNPMWVNNV